MKIICWTHYDLDGAVSYLTLKWAYPQVKIKYETSTPRKFKSDYTKWLKKNNPNKYDMIYILDLDVGSAIDLIDKSNVVIIDHHLSHVNCKYKKAEALIIEYTSAAKLCYKVFKKKLKTQFTKPQQMLIALADDYDSYKLKAKSSLDLNTVFWGQDRKFHTFLKDFKNGFTGFTPYHKNIIKLFYKKFDQFVADMIVYAGDVKLQGKTYRICSVFASDMINEIAEYLVDKYNADIAIIVNSKTQRVSFRKHKTKAEINLSDLAGALCNGAGHAYAAGGEITENFLKFTKILQPI